MTFRLGDSQTFGSIFVLGGFGSTYDEWQPALQALGGQAKWVPIEGHDKGLWGFAESFLKTNSAPPSTTPVLRRALGYSLGARLAMHIHLLSPDFFDRLILVAPNLGLSRWEDRVARWQCDQTWSLRFGNINDKNVWTDWSAQDVFKSSGSLLHRQDHLPPHVLQNQLEDFSLARQDFLVPFLTADLLNKIYFIIGERDEKFRRQLEPLELPTGHLHLVANAGHRVLSDNPTEFIRILKGLAL